MSIGIHMKFDGDLVYWDRTNTSGLVATVGYAIAGAFIGIR